jgi:hypothetical protein
MSLAGCAGDTDLEEEHVHHSFPEHRPANYKDAVGGISLRAWELANRGGRIGSREFGHFVDIIAWVPEMAADSDMTKADWDKANAAATRLKSLVLSSDLRIGELESVVAEELATLKALVPKAGKPEVDLHHSDHHHHHDDHHDGPDEH